MEISTRPGAVLATRPVTGRPGIIERAYQLAESGQCANLGEIKKHLRAGGFADIDRQLFGRVMGADLRRRCDESRAARLATAGIRR
jgi:hypothetical protein